jgi:hypothetical protein
MNVKHFQRLHELIQESDEQGLLVKTQGLSGLSGDKLIGILQRLARYQKEIGGGCYLEVGVFQGLTLLSVAKTLSDSPAFGIDSYADGDQNKTILDERIDLNQLDNAHLINRDYEEALEDLEKFIGPGRIGTYFVDGPHDYRSQLTCLQLVRRYLSDSAVVIVDDCNYRHVRLATRDFLVANPEFKLLFEAYSTCHPKNMGDEGQKEAQRGWWNGINVIVRDPQDILDTMYPATLRDRTLYVNEHSVHSIRYGVLAPEAASLVSSILGFRPIAAAKQCIKLLLRARRANRELIGQYASMNTFSEDLPPSRVNRSLTGEDS